MSKASGYCDPAFAKIGDVFTKAIESEFELGASLAIEHKGKMVVDMFLSLIHISEPTRPY